MLNGKNDARAAYFFERALSFGDADGDLYLLLGESYLRVGHFSEAKNILRAALALYDEPTTSHGTNDHRQAERTWARENLHHLEQGAIKDLIPLTQIQGARVAYPHLFSLIARDLPSKHKGAEVYAGKKVAVVVPAYNEWRN